MTSPDRWLLREVALDGSILDCRLRGPVVDELGPQLEHHGEEVLDAAGGALLPGLLDHHVHVFALAASLDSVDLGGAPDLDAAPNAPAGRWLRVVGAGGELGRDEVDRRWPDVPVRVQHRSGMLWTLNSPAIDRVGAGLTDDERRTGRLWRSDDRLASLLADIGERPVGDPAAAGALLASYGFTSLTDATPDLDRDSVIRLAREIPQHLVSMAAGGTGPRKIVVEDHSDFGELVRQASESHEQGRPVAMHNVTAATLALSLAALRAVEVLEGDRLEHVALCDGDTAEQIAELGLTVVTQPTIFARHGEAFLRETRPRDHPCLWRYASLLSAGVRVAASSDAPYGDPEPARTIAAAVTRPVEGVDARTVLASLLSSHESPGGAARRVEPGTVADLCLLSMPLEDALEAAVRGSGWPVRATFISGAAVYLDGTHRQSA